MTDRIKIATCDLFTDKNTWVLVSEEIAQELIKKGIIKPINFELASGSDSSGTTFSEDVVDDKK